MRTVDPVRHAARRREILDAAAGVFAVQGYDNATTAAVCREAGVGSGTLFHYFGDKRSLFVGLFEDDLPALETLIASLPADPVAALFALLDGLTADASHPYAAGLVVAALQLATRDEAFSELLEEHDRRVRDALARLLRRGLDAGTITATIDPVHAARWIAALVDGLYFMAGEEAVDVESERSELCTIAARYLGISGESIGLRVLGGGAGRAAPG